MTTDRQAVQELTEAANVLASTADIALRRLGQRVLHDIRCTMANKPKPEPQPTAEPKQ